MRTTIGFLLTGLICLVAALVAPTAAQRPPIELISSSPVLLAEGRYGHQLVVRHTGGVSLSLACTPEAALVDTWPISAYADTARIITAQAPCGTPQEEWLFQLTTHSGESLPYRPPPLRPYGVALPLITST